MLEQSVAVTRFELATNTTEMLQNVRREIDTGSFDAVALVPYRENLDATHADAETLIALAGVRLALRGRAFAGTRVLAELRETRAAELALLVNPDDLILSDALTSSLIAQLSDRPALDGVLADLLDYHGAAIFVHPLERWPALGRLGVVRFEEVVEHVAAQGEIALGLRVNGDVAMNPDRTVEHPTSVISGVVVLGAGVDWGADSIQSRIADLGD